MLGRLETRFPFEKVLGSVYQIGSLKELPRSEMTVKTAEMAAIYQSEKNRADAIKQADKT